MSALSERLFPAALKEMSGEYSGYHAISRILPDIFQAPDVRTIGLLFDAFRANIIQPPPEGNFPYTVELMTLLASNPLYKDNLSFWVTKLLKEVGYYDLRNVIGEKTYVLAEVLGKIGVLSFSFPIWRFLAQRQRLTDGNIFPSLLERFGMVRVTRTSDVYQFWPNIDWLGAGYIKQCGNFTHTIEYRRAYLRVTMHGVGTLLIRNSSYFWGRDKLEHPAYFSPQDISEETLLYRSPCGREDRFLTPLLFSKLWVKQSGQTMAENVDRLKILLDALLIFDKELCEWFLPTHFGWDYLLDNLSLRATSGVKLPYLAFIDQGVPPWFPLSVFNLEQNQNNLIPSALEFMKAGNNGKAKLVLLSGTDGDLPIARE